MLAGALQELPLKVTALPVKSTAMQNDTEEHETDVSGFVPSMLIGELHELPLNIRTLPLESTAAQKDGDGHDRELGPSDQTDGGWQAPRRTVVGQRAPILVQGGAERRR